MEIKTNKTGLITYCDGSIFGSATATTPVGSGLHAVLFSDEKYDGRVLDKEHVFTNKGYLIKADNKDLKAFSETLTQEEFVNACLRDTVYAKPIWIKEIAFGWDGYGTNSIAELRAMAEAMRLMLETKAAYNVIYCDSEYVLNNTLKSLPKWVKNNWILSSGQPVANKEDWMEILNLIKQLADAGINYRLLKIKGHKEAKGDKNSAVAMSNEYADTIASIGSSMANNIKFLKATQPDLPNKLEIHQTLEESLKERNPRKIHPFLINKRYYTGWGARADKKRHYVGNPGSGEEDIYIGKQIPDASIGVVYLDEEDPVINMVEEVQNMWLNQHYQHDNYVTTFMLDTISNTKDYALLEKHGKAWIARKQGIPNLRTINGKDLTYVNDPLYLSLYNIEFLKEMEHVLSLYGTDMVAVTDITDTLYETKDLPTSDILKSEMKVDSLKVGSSLKKSIDGTLKAIFPVVKFGGNDEMAEKSCKVTLTTGIDMPRRNQLKAIDGEFPLVQILTWKKDGILYHYGIIIFIHKLVDNKLVRTGFGFYRGTFSSQLFVD